MHHHFDTYIPPGYTTVTPYLMVSDPEGLITFLERAFHATVEGRTYEEENGQLINALLLIGQSRFMVGWARPPFAR